MELGVQGTGAVNRSATTTSAMSRKKAQLNSDWVAQGANQTIQNLVDRSTKITVGSCIAKLLIN